MMYLTIIVLPQGPLYTPIKESKVVDQHWQRFREPGSRRITKVWEFIFPKKHLIRIIFLISPEFSGEDKVESLLVLLGCFVMFRHNLLGLLGGRPSQRDCGLQELEMYFIGRTSLYFNCGQASQVAIDINEKDPPFIHNQPAKRQNLEAIVTGNFSGYFLFWNLGQWGVDRPIGVAGLTSASEVVLVVQLSLSLLLRHHGIVVSVVVKYFVARLKGPVNTILRPTKG